MFILPILASWLISSSAASGQPRSFAGLTESHHWDAELGDSLSPAVPSPYAVKLREILRKRIAGVDLDRQKPAVESAVQLICYETEGNPFYIGAKQQMTVEADLKTVASTVDEFTKYTGIFKGLILAEPVRADGNLVLTRWEEHIPVPFVPNERNETWYLVAQPSSNLKIYRYSLAKSNHLNKSDGFIMLKAQGTRTLFTEYDFFDADWGIAKALGVDHAWKESLEGLYQSDMALKLRAEHPDWSSKRVLEESTYAAEKAPLEQVIKYKQHL